jgi:hypothetical protein
MVAEQVGAEPKIMLREGKYILLAKHGEMWGKERLNITAGEIEKIKVKLTKDVGMPVVTTSKVAAK